MICFIGYYPPPQFGFKAGMIREATEYSEAIADFRRMIFVNLYKKIGADYDLDTPAEDEANDTTHENNDKNNTEDEDPEPVCPSH